MGLPVIETDPTAGNIVIGCCSKRGAVLGWFSSVLIVALFLPMTTVGEEEKAKEYPGLGKPQILYDAGKDFVVAKDWIHGWFQGLAFRQDSCALVGSLGIASQTKFFLRRDVGEVRSFGLTRKGGGSKIVVTAPDESFSILKMPSGACREPLLLVRSQPGRRGEYAVIQINGSKMEESLVQKIQIPRAEKMTIHMAKSICFAITPAPEAVIMGTGCIEWKGQGASATTIYWGDVKAWDIRTGKVRFADAWEGNQVLDIACSADGKMVAAGGGHSTKTFFGGARYDGHVVCWGKNFEKKRLDLALPNHQIHCLAFSPDNKSLVTGGLDGVIKWINVAKGTVTKSLDVASRSGKTLGRIESLAFSPDGNLLAAGVGSWNRGNKWGETFLIDVPKAEVYKVPASQEDHVITCVAFSPDGKYLAAGGMEGLLKLWQIQ